MDRPAWAPEGVDMQQASPARMYDALLGGSHNFEVDRRAAEMGTKLVPDLPRLALSNRAFLRRAVRYLVEAGVTQFLDIGSGIPTAGNVHEIAQRAALAPVRARGRRLLLLTCGHRDGPPCDRMYRPRQPSGCSKSAPLKRCPEKDTSWLLIPRGLAPSRPERARSFGVPTHRVRDSVAPEACPE